MSELQNKPTNRTNYRWQLLATVSAMALAGSVYGIDQAKADDSDRPTVWIELGGQLSRLGDSQETFSPPIMDGRPPILEPSQKFEHMPRSSIDETGKLSFQPNGSEWTFVAAVRYGRSVNNKTVHQRTQPAPFYATSVLGYHLPTPISIPATAAKFADTAVRNGEQHLIVDFQVGKDVGLGMFGDRNGSSTINLGVRFAQFNSQSDITLKSDPDWKFAYKYIYGFKFFNGDVYHSNAAALQASRNFHGVGPSLSWNASAPVIGDGKDDEVTIDWGLNAAVLFGRQKAVVHHQSTGRYRPAGRYGYRHITTQPAPVNSTRSRSVTVPNVGGFAGASYRIENFKVSAGYRADFFFGAMDGGIDAHKSYDRSFYGPFATISVGLGG